jgi:hypothetical protein
LKSIGGKGHGACRPSAPIRGGIASGETVSRNPPKAVIMLCLTGSCFESPQKHQGKADIAKTSANGSSLKGFSRFEAKMVEKMLKKHPMPLSATYSMKANF